MNERQQAHIDHYLRRLEYWRERKPACTTARVCSPPGTPTRRTRSGARRRRRRSSSTCGGWSASNRAESGVGRRRAKYAAFLLAVIMLGLASRAYSPPPSFVRAYVGDALWAVAAYLTVAFLFPRLPAKWVAMTGGLFSLTVELSQLYHAPWIDGLHQIRLAALLLGHGFL
jgi:hypothetical protein